MTFTTLLGFGLSQLWGWTAAAGIVLGLAISIASTVVLLRGLMDQRPAEYARTARPPSAGWSWKTWQPC